MTFINIDPESMAFPKNHESSLHFILGLWILVLMVASIYSKMINESYELWVQMEVLQDLYSIIFPETTPSDKGAIIPELLYPETSIIFIY
jgi:hypothetical protein